MFTPKIMTDKFARSEAAAIRKYLKGSTNRLMLAEVNGAVWWSDSYLMLPVGAGMTRLLMLHNLPVEPMTCDTSDGTITRTRTDAPNFQGLVDRYVAPKGMKLIRPLTYTGHPIVVRSALAGHDLELWTADGVTVAAALNADIRAMVGRSFGEQIWKKLPGESNAAVRFDQQGDPVGLLMCVRMGEAGSGESLAWTDEQAA